MPTKVNIGLTRKAGLPDYGSIGASCHVELELDSRVLDGDTERFRQHVQHAYAACRKAVEDELSRELAASMPRRTSSDSRNVPVRGATHYNGNGRRATPSQVRAVKAIAGRTRTDLVPLLARFDAQCVEDLHIGDASRLIDELKGQQPQEAGNR